MAKADRRWSLGRTAVSWDEEDKAKVRHMLGRGKSIDFIHDYIGMPIELIEGIERNMDRLDTASSGRGNTRLQQEPAIWRTERDDHAHQAKLQQASREFLMRVRRAGLVAV